MTTTVNTHPQFAGTGNDVAPVTPPKKPLTPEEKAKFMKRLTKGQWAEAKAMWATGEFTLALISEKFDISREALSRRFTKDGVVKGSKAIEEKVRAKVEAAAAQDTTVLLQRIRETKEETYTWARLVGRLTVTKLSKAAQNSENYGSIMKDLMALESASRTIKNSSEMRSKILGLDKDIELDEELPELIITEMSAAEVEERRRNQAADEELTDSQLAQYDPESEDAPDEDEQQA